MIARLEAWGGYAFQGDLEVRIEGVQLGRGQGRIADQFATIIDDEWHGAAPARIREQQEHDLVDWVRSAAASGVAGFITSSAGATHPALAGQKVLSGPTAQETFYRVAGVLRDSRGLSKIAAITGSSGKTTTKRMLAHALRAAAPRARVRSSPKSFNVSTDAAKYLSRSPQVRHSVVEIAGGAFAEYLANDFTVSADVSIVTSIAEAHLDQHGDLEAVATRKAHIFDRPPTAGTAVINLDAPRAEILVERAADQGCQLVTYGESPHAALRLLEYRSETGEVTARVAGESIAYTVGARGKHMALNSLAVIATLRSYRLPGWRRGIDSLATFATLDGRGASHALGLPDGGAVTVVDEAYNANPGSMKVTLQAAAEVPDLGAGRVILVLGDMLELGTASAELHASLASAVAESRAQVTHLYGTDMRHLHAALATRGLVSTHWSDLDELARTVLSDLRAGDTVIVKSSHGTALHELVRSLRSSLAPDPETTPPVPPR
ncbi:Mur ligase family protein [Nesterenkonia sp. HG001]|uniref:Mur ligase family protein n=1 Tax=Nesterenkonia sp. HG001 TaxID=2983207 RepID=UPI002AC658E5|nr:Mur ligase family protein [Nesterenkonia sp. HG001]MDZ5077906.1 Mur ligase family protein [Nesterenkonia sp. HG001]